MKIGPNFINELKAAGLDGLQITWGDDGNIEHHGLTVDQENTLNEVMANHDHLTVNVDTLRQKIKQEAQRRINGIFKETELEASLIKQQNTLKQATHLVFRLAKGEELSESLLSEMQDLDDIGQLIDSIRDASNALEETLPPDYTNDKYWPSS